MTHETMRNSIHTRHSVSGTSCLGVRSKQFGSYITAHIAKMAAGATDAVEKKATHVHISEREIFL